MQRITIDCYGALSYVYAQQVKAPNLFDVKASQIDHFFESRLPGEPAAGMPDIHFHPVEPLAVRFTVAGRF